MDFLKWAISPWGQRVPIHIAWFLIWVAVIAGFLFFIVHATLSAIFRQTQGVCEQQIASDRRAHTRARPQTFADRAAVSLDHGGLHVHAAIYRLSPEGGHSV